MYGLAIIFIDSTYVTLERVRGFHLINSLIFQSLILQSGGRVFWELGICSVLTWDCGICPKKVWDFGILTLMGCGICSFKCWDFGICSFKCWDFGICLNTVKSHMISLNLGFGDFDILRLGFWDLDPPPLSPPHISIQLAITVVAIHISSLQCVHVFFLLKDR